MTTFLVASILLGSCFVNASGLKVSHRELSRFIANSLPTAQDDQATKGLGGVLGIPAGTLVKYGEIDENGSTDGFDHEYQLILSSAGTVTELVFRQSQMTNPDHEESYFFKMSTAGDLELAVLGHLPYKNGRVVRGAATSDLLPIESSDVHHKLQHELDFWLKGKYRKKKAKSK